MSDQVYLRRVRDEGEGVYEWVSPAGPEGEPPRPALGGPEEAAQACAGRHVTLLVPGESVLLTQATVPARNRQRMMQALPYLLEERLAQDVDLMLFAAGPRQRDGTVEVGVIERAWLERELETLREAGIEPEHALPDVLALPLEPDAWTVLEDGGMALVRTGPRSGFAIDISALVPVLGAALAEAGESRPGRLLLHTAEPSALEPGELETLGPVVVATPAAGAPIEFLAAHASREETIELLQGDFSRRERFGRMFRPWLPVAVTLGILLAVHTALLVWDYVRLDRQSAALRAEVTQTFTDAFPGQRVVDPRVQMERALQSLRRGGGDGGGFLDVLAAAAPALQATEGAVLQRLAWRDGQLDVALGIGDVQALDDLVRRIQSAGGVSVDIQSASAANGRVEARLQLRATP